ncbi:MAG: hypothetical protein FWH05_00420 [Oscillospiraceae bacterium]|nr:hypothetical protein [Oscillospiraceae bacterium]
MTEHLSKITNNKGATLAELIVGTALLTIVMLMISMIFTHASRSQQMIVEMAELGAMIDDVSNPLIRDLTSASVPLRFDASDCIHIPVCNPDNPTTCWANGVSKVAIPQPASVYAIEDGLLVRTCTSLACPLTGDHTHTVFPSEFYKNKNVNFTCEPTGTIGNAYLLTVVIAQNDTDTELLRREYVVRPLRVNLPDSET